MNAKGTIGRLVLACLLSTSTFALDPSRALTQYGHTAWRVREGYFSAPPLAIAQTKDGQLWLGGEGGLLRFDGVQFTPWKPPDNQALPDERIYGLLGASDGSLWIGTGRGLARWKNDKLTVYAKVGQFESVLEDHQGTIWAGHTRDLNLLPPLCRLATDEFKCFSFSDDPELVWAGALKEDRNGDLWIGSSGAVCRWRSGKSECYAIPAPRLAGQELGVRHIAIDSDGTLWVDGGVTGIWQLASGRWKHYDEFREFKLWLKSSLVDREGNLWFGDVSQGVIRHVGSRVDRFDRVDGLSGDKVTAIFEDREGNVWTATSAGLDRFRDVKVATITQREGLPGSVDSVMASRDGSLWIVGSQLLHVKMRKLPSYEVVRGLPENGELAAPFEDSGGHLWLGVGTVLTWRENEQFHEFPSFRLHRRSDRVRGISEDVQGNIWAATTDPEYALIRIRDGRILDRYTRHQIGEQITAMASDPRGGMWLSRANLTPGLILARDGRFELHANEFPGSAGNMFFDSDGLWASTRKGAFCYDRGTLKMLSTKNGLPCDNLDAAIKDDSGALWLRGTCGLIQIPASELELWLGDPGRRVQFRYLDAFDGTQAGTSWFVHTTKTSDGRIWFALGGIGAVQVVDPKRLQDNPIPPPVAVTKLVADHRVYTLNSKLRLPALTRDIEIDYTAYSLMIPEKVHFRYRLEGVDQSWQDVGPRRQAYFTNLKPGHYHFNVSASNNDGLWNKTEASLDFAIAPAFYQTGWFIALCAVSAIVLLYVLYLLRRRRVEHQFKERLEERERIARELHDTLLQSVQGLIFKFEGIAKQINPTEPVHQTIEKTLDHADMVLAEARDRVRNLRESSASHSDLPQEFRRIAEAIQQGNGTFKTIVEGRPRELHPMVLEEVYCIGREALVNAFNHSGGQLIEIEISYHSRQFRLRIRDDGSGIDPVILEQGGYPGHWGMRGMRERSQRIGASLKLWSRPATGTEVELTVPAASAYRSLQKKKFSLRRSAS